MHTCTCIGRGARGKRLPAGRGTVPCSKAPLQWTWTGTSPATSPRTFFSGPIGKWTGDQLVPRPSPYRLSYCRPSRVNFPADFSWSHACVPPCLNSAALSELFSKHWADHSSVMPLTVWYKQFSHLGGFHIYLLSLDCTLPPFFPQQVHSFLHCWQILFCQNSLKSHKLTKVQPAALHFRLQCR